MTSIDSKFKNQLICVICVTLLWRIVKYFENWWSIMVDRTEKKKKKERENKFDCFKKWVYPALKQP